MVKSKKKVDKLDNTLTNWYEKIPSSMITKYENPSYDNHKINIPARILIVGATGSGKTTLVLELLKRMRNTFSYVIICTRDINEPLYKFFISKLDPEQFEVHEQGEIPDLNKFKDRREQVFMVFDDLVLADQKKIEEFFIRGRKLANGITMVYLTQSYFKVPKIIRLQVSYVFLKKLASTRDLNMILKDNSLNVNKTQLYNMYEYATQNKSDFLLMDLEADERERFRLNFLQTMNPTDF